MLSSPTLSDAPEGVLGVVHPSSTDSRATTPAGFAIGVLGLKLHQWQLDVLFDMEEPGSVALKAANGSGKTRNLGAPLALWHTACHKNALTVITSGTWRQVKEQVFAAIKAHQSKFRGWVWNDASVSASNGSKIIGFSASESGRFEGFHALSPDSPLLIIVDEAKTVPDSIFEAISKCNPTRLLLMSSTGGPAGAFYNAFTKNAKLFKTHSVTAYDCPHITKEEIERTIAEYGERHPHVRSKIFSEFMEDDDGSHLVIPYTKLERCILSPPTYKKGDRVAFCDFAAGGDENVLAIRDGNRIQNLICWREKDTMAAVGRFIVEFRKAELTYDQIFADEGGLGKPMCDALAEAGWPIHRVNNGAAPYNKIAYGNRGTEMWFVAAKTIENGEISLPASDTTLIAQLTTRKHRIDSKGRLFLETKDDMRLRGLTSPDRADAVVGCIANHPMKILNYSFSETSNPWSTEEEDYCGEIAGAYAGE
jgi:phage terminase large subunit